MNYYEGFTMILAKNEKKKRIFFRHVCAAKQRPRKQLEFTDKNVGQTLD